MSGDKSFFTKFLSVFSSSRDKTLEYRTRALYFFLPKWKGFVVDGRTEQVDVNDALSKLNNVVSCLSNVWTEESGHREKRKPNNFDLSKVILWVCFESVV